MPAKRSKTDPHAVNLGRPAAAGARTHEERQPMRTENVGRRIRTIMAHQSLSPLRP
jgi:hypothetical protein